MNIRHSTLAIAAFAALVGAGVAPIEPLAPAPAVAQQAKATEADRTFIDRMVPHHEMGIYMADMAIQHAQHAELKTFAQRMKASQQKDIKELKAWRAQWFGSANTPEMEHDMMPQLPHGPEFDVRWAQMIAMHHQGAIDLSRLLQATPGQSKLRDKAKQMMAMQEKEKDQLLGFLKAWR